jgi:hypothetical protein
VDPTFLDDLKLIFSHVVRAVIARFADGEIPITEVLPVLERTLFRLMAGAGVVADTVAAAPAVRRAPLR